MLHKNLLSLKAYEGDVSELGLYFTIVCDELGETREEDLKPNGSNIPVTSANRLEYIQLMADFKLNKQIRKQCVAFRQGLSNVLPIQWLYMFSNKELQVLISGAEIPVNIDDLKQHTRYSGDFCLDHPTIVCFWNVLHKFNDIQRRQLLKFVTSCSRPPLLGFKVKNIMKIISRITITKLLTILFNRIWIHHSVYKMLGIWIDYHLLVHV